MFFTPGSTMLHYPQSERGAPQKKPPFCKIKKWYLTELFSILVFILQHHLPSATCLLYLCTTKSCLFGGWMQEDQ